MIFCLPALASLSGKQPYSATFRASWLARSAHTESKALLSSCFLRVTIVAVTPTKKYYCAVRRRVIT